MFLSSLPSASIPVGTKRSSAVRPRRANDQATNGCNRVRRTHPPRRAPVCAARLCRRVPQFLQTRLGVSKNTSRQHRGTERREITRRARRRVAKSPRPHGSSSPLPRLSLCHRTTCSGGAEPGSASDGAAALGFLDCQPRILLATRRQVRPASRRVRAVPSPSLSATLRRVSRCADAAGSHGYNCASLPAVRLAPAHRRAASGRRQREEFLALLILFPGVGVPPDSLPHVWRTSRNQAPRLRGRTIAPHSRRSLRHLQVFPHHSRPD